MGFVNHTPLRPWHSGLAHGSELRPFCLQMVCAASVAKLIDSTLAPCVAWSYRLGRARTETLETVRERTRTRVSTFRIACPANGDELALTPCISLETSLRIHAASRVLATGMLGT